MRRKRQDCGCGNGSKNCISKKSLVRFVDDECKKLDCGCGCKGVKGFCEKYGIVLRGGSILADCPPGWRNDGLTCVENCNSNEYDDGLTCRKKCDPGWINDGLTCRKPITSSMNSCPPGSRDIWGTCWGPVRRDCIDDCFKHPAPGCKTWQCGRLRGLFGEDWGPKLCTSCNLRCGQTCWDVQGITKQLHQRELKLYGGEVIGQAIRGKQIRGRVNFDKLFDDVAKGLKDFVEQLGDPQTWANAFDPEKNGIASAMRKFGDDMKKVLEDVGSRIKRGFEKMGEDAKRAFEQFAKDAESKFKQFGEDFVHMMKDPDFWVEAIGILAMVAGAAVSIAVTVGTLGLGAPATAGIMAAAAMAGPAAKMIAAAARNEPIDALDIAAIAVAAGSAFVPGLSGIVGPLTQAGIGMALTAASYAITGVQVGQSLGLIPSTCIANCPSTEGIPDVPPFDPPIPGPPPPPGQKTDEEILALQPENTIKYRGGKNPDYMTSEDWIAKYRAENYGAENVTGPANTLITPEDRELDNITNTGNPEPVYVDDLKLETVADLGTLEDLPPLGDLGDLGDLGTLGDLPPLGDLGDLPPLGDLGDLSGLEMEGGVAPESLPSIEPIKEGDTTSNFWGNLSSTLPKRNIPRTHLGNEFNPDCYARKNPEIAKESGNDKEKLTAHWIDIGSKEAADAECSGEKTTAEERMKLFAELEALEGIKQNCAATDKFWVESEKRCDGLRHKDGRPNLEAAKCKQEYGHYEQKEPPNKPYCNRYRNEQNNIKSIEEKCSMKNGHWANGKCDTTKNVDGSVKTDADYCTGLNNYYKDGVCDVKKDRDGKEKTEQEMCNENANYWTHGVCDVRKYPDGFLKGKQEVCQSVLNGRLNVATSSCEEVDGQYPYNYAQMEEYLKDKKLKVRDFHSTSIPSSSRRWIVDTRNPQNQNYEMSKVLAEKFTEQMNNPDIRDQRFLDSMSRRFTYIPPQTGQQFVNLRDIKGNAKPKSKSKSLTLYYADWCPHCHDMMPEWNKLGKNHKGIKVEKFEENETDFKVDGFPTIIFRDGKKVEKYEGDRSKKAIVSYLKNKLS
jgi:thiol-disulfide isomerase/thioredoxin